MRRAVPQTSPTGKKKVAAFFAASCKAISTTSGGGSSRNNSVDVDPKEREIVEKQRSIYL